jgi:hypothetical protein
MPLQLLAILLLTLGLCREWSRLPVFLHAQPESEML